MNKYRYILFQRYIKFDMLSQKHILKLQYIRPAFVAKTLTKCKSAQKIEIFIITSDILEQAINLTFTFIHLLTDSSIDPVIKERTTLVCPNFSPTHFNTLQDLPLGSRPNRFPIKNFRSRVHQGTIHILRNHLQGGRGGQKMPIFDYFQY